MVLVAFVLGIVGGAGVVMWLDRPAAPRFPADEHAVELILFEVVRPQAYPSGRTPAPEPMRLDGAVLLSGLVASKVLRVDHPNDSLRVRTPALPVTVSPTARLEPVSLEITVRDCAAVSSWNPADRPFNITWRDENGKVHSDRAGDFGESIATSLTGYIDAVCDSAP